MNKKVKIIIGILVFLTIIVLIIMTNRNKNKKSEISTNLENKKPEIVLKNNGSDTDFTIIDNTTGEVLYKTDSENSAEEWMDFYQRNPDYRASQPF